MALRDPPGGPRLASVLADRAAHFLQETEGSRRGPTLLRCLAICPIGTPSPPLAFRIGRAFGATIEEVFQYHGNADQAGQDSE